MQNLGPVIRFAAAAMLCFLVVVPATADLSDIKVTVDAGQQDRTHAPVRALIRFPEGWIPDTVKLVGADGKSLDGQWTRPSLLPEVELEEGRTDYELHFILPQLKAGETATYQLSAAEKPDTVPFSWHDEEGVHLDLKLGDRNVIRYMYQAPDYSDTAKYQATYKVFHHIFDPATGEQRLSKGVGGAYGYQRGLFYGFAKMFYGVGRRSDVWSCRGDSHQSHKESLSREAGPVLGRHRAAVNWHGLGRDVFASEEREVTAYAVPGGTLLEFASRLRSNVGRLQIEGDPQNAGVTFRAHEQVAANSGRTYFLRPDGKGAPGKMRSWNLINRNDPINRVTENLPWNSMSFVVDDKRYSIAYIDRPDNPKLARYSERTYGRINSSFDYIIHPEASLDVRYRLWVKDGEMTAEEIDAHAVNFAEPMKVTVQQPEPPPTETDAKDKNSPDEDKTNDKKDAAPKKEKAPADDA